MTQQKQMENTAMKKQTTSNDTVRQFRVALASAGISQATWSRQHGVSKEFVSRCLHGIKRSRRITTKIALFTHEQLTSLKSNHTSPNKDK
jgi:hypothetical protein